MIKINAQQLIDFVRKSGKLKLTTLAQKKPFSIELRNGDIVYLNSKKNVRKHEKKWLERVCKKFSEGNSLHPKDYRKITINASYTLALISAFLRANDSISINAATSQIRNEVFHGSRKQFIISQGATCKNWTWSWSFINKKRKIILFGAWDHHAEGETSMIFSEKWKINARGRKSSGYDQSREHLRLIEGEGYRLMTFPMKASDAKKGEDGLGPAAIESFRPVVREKILTRVANSWYASDSNLTDSLPEEIVFPEKYQEGAKTLIVINAFERNPKARKACIAHYGPTCQVCGFNFQTIYGTLGLGFIHVHHIKPIGSIGAEYEVDPIADLIPVCPNCHAMIHRNDPPLSIKKLRSHLKALKDCKRVPLSVR